MKYYSKNIDLFQHLYLSYLCNFFKFRSWKIVSHNYWSHQVLFSLFFSFSEKNCTKWIQEKCVFWSLFNCAKFFAFVNANMYFKDISISFLIQGYYIKRLRWEKMIIQYCWNRSVDNFCKIQVVSPHNLFKVNDVFVLNGRLHVS